MVRYAASFTVHTPSTPSTRINITPVARREQAIQRGLSKRLAQLAAERERRERAAAKADAEFSAEFLSMARKCFDLIDKDGSGTLEKPEIVQAVRADQVTNAASYDRAPFDLRGLRGTAVFVCLVCGGAESDYSSNYEHTHTKEQPHDRVTLRLRDRS